MESAFCPIRGNLTYLRLRNWIFELKNPPRALFNNGLLKNNMFGRIIIHVGFKLSDYIKSSRNLIRCKQANIWISLHGVARMTLCKIEVL